MTGSLQHLGGDRWKVRVYAGVDPTTKVQRLRSRNFRAPNARAAQRAMTKIAAELMEQVVEAKAHADTVAGLADQWLDKRRDLGRSPSTIAAYERLAKVIVAEFGRVRVAELTGRDIDRWYAKLARKLDGDGARAVSDAEIRHIHAVLRAMLAQAVKWGMVDRNATAAATPPPAGRYKHKLPTREALQAVLADAGREVAVALHISAATGARRGEVVGLQWGDIDPDGRLHIRRSLLNVRGYRSVPKSTKTDRERVVDIDPGLLALLEAWRVEHAERCAQLGIAPSPWLFPNWQKGGKIARPPDWLSKQWTDLAARHGLDANLHSVRHFSASTLVAGGIPIIEVSKRLGHAQTSTTLNIYGHLIPGERGRSADVMARELGRGTQEEP